MNRSLSSVILDELGRAPDGLTPTELHDAVLARPEALENDNVYRLFRGHDGQDAARAAADAADAADAERIYQLARIRETIECPVI